MGNNVENVEKAVEIGTEVMDATSGTSPLAKKIVGGVFCVAIVVGVGYGIYRIVKNKRKEKSVIDGEILGVEQPEEE